MSSSSAGKDEDEVAALRRELGEIQRIAERERGLLEAVLLQSPYGIIVSDAKGRLIVENRASQRIWAGTAPTRDVKDWNQYRAFHPDGRPFEAGDWTMARSLLTGQRFDAEEFRILRFDGRRAVLLGGSAPVFGSDGAVLGAVAVFADVTPLKRGEAAQRLLADASALLATSLDYETTLRNVASLALPDFADLCILDILDAPGSARRVCRARSAGAQAHLDAAVLPSIAVADAMLAMPTLLVADTSVPAAARDDVVIPRELAVRSLLRVPLTLHGRLLGAVTLFYTDAVHGERAGVSGPDRRYDDVDIGVAEELARRASIAIDNARLYEKLHAEERRFRAIFDHALDAIVISDEAGVMIDVNAGACALFVRAREALVGARLVDLLAPEKSADLATERAAFVANGTQRGEATVLCGDGTVKLVEYNATANLLPGRHMSILRNIDARRRAETALEFLAEASAVLGSSLNYDATLASVVRLAVPKIADWATVDMKDEGALLRRIAVAHEDAEVAARAQAAFQANPISVHGSGIVAQVLRTGTATIVSDVDEASITRPVSEPPTFEEIRELGLRSYMAVPLRVRGQPVGVLGFATTASRRRFGAQDLALVTDLARRAGVAIENAVSYREAQEANRLKDEFLATVSHELRTPLNAILGWSTLLRTRVTDPAAVQRGLDTIERNARAQARLIDDVLDVSRIITGKLRIEARRVDVVAVVKQALEVVATMATARDVALDAVLGSEPCVLVGDADRLQQIVWNLLSNAIKFTKKGGTVTVHVYRDGATVYVRVADTGQGIRPDFLPFIFDRFRQADSSSTRAHGGLGLGLAIVRHLAELHGGRVVAESEGEGRGATFTLTLPVRAVHSEPPPHGETGAALGERAPSSGHVLAGLRIVIVDDEPDARELLHELLTHAGADVVVASSAAEALDAVVQHLPDVLVSDVGMPGEDGYSLLRRLRSLPATRGGRTPAIALTAYVREEDTRRALAAGFQRHVGKPVDPRELVTVVANLGGRVSDP